MGLKKWLTVSLLALLSIACANAIVKDVRTYLVEKRATEATFVLVEQWGVTETITHPLCTATAYEKTGKDTYHLITAGHCYLVEGGKFFVQHDIGKKQTLYPVAVLKHEFDTPVDFMVLELKTSEKIPTIPLGDERDASLYDPILDVNFSLMFTKHHSHGVIASNIMDESSMDPDYGDCELCVNRYMVQLFAGPGASGSSVIDLNSGKIIGVLTGGSNATIGAMVEPISDFKPWLTGKPKPATLWSRLKMKWKLFHPFGSHHGH